MIPASLHPYQVSASSQRNPPLSLSEISERIRSLDAISIELIGIEIGKEILDGLGARSKIKNLEILENSDSMEISNGIRFIRENAKIAEENKEELLTKIEAIQFSNMILFPIKRELEKAFSMAECFMAIDAYFNLSEYGPSGVLAEAAEKMNLNLNFLEIPIKWAIQLALDKEETKKREDLVFTLTQRMRGREIGKRSFSLSELNR